MTLYQPKPFKVEAKQWMKYGDHPKVRDKSNRFYPVCGELYDDDDSFVRPGDWIVGPYPDGHYEVMNQEDFAAKFEEVKE